MLNHMAERPRRLRRHPAMREMVAETQISLSQLIQPYFVTLGNDSESPIKGFTEVYRWGIDKLSKKIESDLDRGLKQFLLFGDVSPEHKDPKASALTSSEGLIPETLRKLKQRFGKEVFLFTDVCLCAGTDSGHCGVVAKGEVENDSSVKQLAQIALTHAQAGADFVAPSDMMDGRIGAIRRQLDSQAYSEVGILAYTAKYASYYYGPFREALGSSPSGSAGSDRKSYQMDFRDSRTARRELRLDIEEGADIAMVKPALAYLDIIKDLSEISDIPIAAYSVSGEYELVKAIVARGMADERGMVLENLTAMRRSGAQIILTYYASLIAEKGWL